MVDLPQALVADLIAHLERLQVLERRAQMRLVEREARTQQAS